MAFGKGKSSRRNIPRGYLNMQGERDHSQSERSELENKHKNKHFANATEKALK